MFNAHIALCNKLIDKFDNYIAHIEANIYDESCKFLNKIPRNDAVLVSDLDSFFENTEDIIITVYTKKSAEYNKWRDIIKKYNEDEHRACKDAERRQKKSRRYGNFILSELSKVQRDCISQTVNLFTTLQIKYESEKSKKKNPEVMIIHGDNIDNKVIGNVKNIVGKGDINITSEQKQDIDEIRLKIEQILEKLELEYPTKTLVQKALVVEKTIEQIEANENWKQKVISAVKVMGIQAFIEIIDNPIVNVLSVGIENWIEKSET